MGALEGRLGAPTGWDRQDEHCPAAASGLQTGQAPELPWEQSSDLPGASGGSVPRLWNAHQADPQGSDVLPQQSLGRAINSPAKRGAANLSGAGCPRGQSSGSRVGTARGAALLCSTARGAAPLRPGRPGLCHLPGHGLVPSSPRCSYSLSARHCSVHSSSLHFLLLTSLLKQGSGLDTLRNSKYFICC